MFCCYGASCGGRGDEIGGVERKKRHRAKKEKWRNDGEDGGVSHLVEEHIAYEGNWTCPS